MNHRLVFIGGLHRSGTTPLARWMSEHPQISGFSDTGVWEDEGQHLQDVVPPARAYGGPGLFALDHASRLTESSPLLTEENGRRMWGSWAEHWDLERPVLLEKSPPNMIRMRFLQAMFPGSLFIVVVRHPIAVTYATKKWARTRSVAALLRNWCAAQGDCLADAAHVERLRFVRYEDLIADPAAELDRLYAFIGLEAHEHEIEVRPRLNEKYFERWGASGPNPVKRARAALLSRRFDEAAGAWGYDLRDPRPRRPRDTRVAAQMAGLPGAERSRS
ncbi:sulfotransferase [Thermoleophilia bacterium SCSIO 60948]|nr:sulfotransferase [Thermoleophilia bacterium SCSIO 60948]